MGTGEQCWHCQGRTNRMDTAGTYEAHRRRQFVGND